MASWNRMPEQLIIVAGHAALRRFADPRREENWVLLDFQHNEVPYYLEHVRRGVEQAARHPDSVVLFSGGMTRREAGPRSEAISYLYVAEFFNWWGHPEVAGRAHTEDFARDSYENLLFSLCRFREIAGRYPSAVTMVSWAFKRQRFYLHGAAIGWPAARLHFEGPDNPADFAQALVAEEIALARYHADPYSSGEEFRRKREARNPFHRQHGYATSCPELAELLLHRGPEPFRRPLPWSGMA